MHPSRPVRVAAVQQPPAFLDLAGSLERAVQWTRDAVAEGAELVVFPETWLPGYPIWLDVAPSAGLWDHGPAKEVFRALFENSIAIPSPEVELLAQLSRETGAILAMGANERSGGSLYNTILYFTPERGLAARHRKLMPTYTERLVWAQGVDHLLPSLDTALGTIGGLVCWEHWMPLARQALHETQEFVHVAQWPTVKDSSLLASRHYAFEGRCYVVACGTVLHRKELPDFELFAEIPDLDDGLLMRGGSTILGPEGETLAAAGTEPTLLLATLDPARWVEGRLTLDVAGHYARPDVFSFGRADLR